MGLRPGKTKGPYVGLSASSIAAMDTKAKVTANDTTTSYLDSKIVAGSGITKTVLNPGANETLEISAPGSTTDEKVKVTAFDTTTAYLGAKIASGTGISLAVANPGSNEILVITNTGSADINAKVSAADTTTGYLDTKITVGAGLTKSITSPGGDERLNIALTTAQSTKFRQFHTLTPDSVDIEGGATKTDYLSTNNSNRFRIIELPEGSDLHFSIAMHPKYDGGNITAKAHWVVVDASHNTAHSMEYNAYFYRNTDSMDVNETERAWNFQADTANDLMYIDSVAALTVEGTYNTAGTLLHFRLGHKSDCAASGSIKILAIEISYLCTLE